MYTRRQTLFYSSSSHKSQREEDPHSPHFFPFFFPIFFPRKERKKERKTKKKDKKKIREKEKRETKTLNQKVVCFFVCIFNWWNTSRVPKVFVVVTKALHYTHK